MRQCCKGAQWCRRPAAPAAAAIGNEPKTRIRASLDDHVKVKRPIFLKIGPECPTERTVFLFYFSRDPPKILDSGQGARASVWCRWKALQGLLDDWMGIEKAGLVATGDCVFGSLFLNVFGFLFALAFRFLYLKVQALNFLWISHSTKWHLLKHSDRLPQ